MSSNELLEANKLRTKGLGINHRWLILAIGVAAQASFAVTFSGLPVIGIVMRSLYKLSIGQLGFILGCMALGVTISEIIWGVLTDRFGDRKVLLIGLISMGTMLALMSLFVTPYGQHVPQPWLLAISLVLVGALGGSINSSSGRAVMAWFDDGKRGFAMSIRQTAIPVGGAIGAALLPFLVQNYSFSITYAALATFCFASAIATWNFLYEKEPPTASNTIKEPSNQPSPLWRLDIWRLALASGLLCVPQMAVLTFGGVFLHDAKQVGIAGIAVTILIMQVGGGILRIWSGRYTDKHKNRRSMIRIIGVCASVTTFGLAIFINTPTIVSIIFLCASGLIASSWHGIAYTEMATMAGVGRAGTALGIEGTTIFATAFITPFLIPLLLAGSSWVMVWVVVAVCTLVAVPLSPGKNTKA